MSLSTVQGFRNAYLGIRHLAESWNADGRLRAVQQQLCASSLPDLPGRKWTEAMVLAVP